MPAASLEETRSARILGAARLDVMAGNTPQREASDGSGRIQVPVAPKPMLF